MRNGRKSEYQRRKIRQLEEEVKGLRAEKSAIERENTSLHKTLDASRAAMEHMTAEHEKMQKSFRKSMDEAIAMKKKYESLIAVCLSAKKDYAKKMSDVIDHVRIGRSKLN